MIMFRANLKKMLELILDLLKNQMLSCNFSIFCDFLDLLLYRKRHGWSLWITRPWLALGPWWTHDRGAVQSLWGLGGRRDNSERERRPLRFSLMAPLRGEAAEMVTQRHSTEAIGGAMMGT
jgi:hypothetical protein